MSFSQVPAFIPTPGPDFGRFNGSPPEGRWFKRSGYGTARRENAVKIDDASVV